MLCAALRTASRSLSGGSSSPRPRWELSEHLCRPLGLRDGEDFAGTGLPRQRHPWLGAPGEARGAGEAQAKRPSMGVAAMPWRRNGVGTGRGQRV